MAHGIEKGGETLALSVKRAVEDGIAVGRDTGKRQAMSDLCDWLLHRADAPLTEEALYDWINAYVSNDCKPLSPESR